MCGKKERWRLKQKSAGMIQETNRATYSGFGKPDGQAVHVNFACVYVIYALKKLLL